MFKLLLRRITFDSCLKVKVFSKYSVAIKKGSTDTVSCYQTSVKRSNFHFLKIHPNTIFAWTCLSETETSANFFPFTYEILF
jgi:hypothetical protein